MTNRPSYRTAEHAPRCTNATVEALTGVMPKRLLIWGTSVMEELRELGYRVEINPHNNRPFKTLRAMSKDLPEGSWYISTAGHALALVDGVLTDTEDKGFDLRRIQCMFRVTKR